MPLMEPQESFELLPARAFIGHLRLLIMLLWIVEHPGAETTFAVFVGKYIIVGAALTAFPKSFVGGQLGVGDRFISQIRVDLHYGHTGGDTENFSIGLFFGGGLKNRV